MANFCSIVVLFNAGFQFFRIHAGLLGQFFQCIGFYCPTCFFSCRPFFFEFGEFCSDWNHYADALDDTVMLHGIEVLVVINNPHLATNSFKSVSGCGPVAHNCFVAETISARCKPKMRLLSSGRNVVCRSYSSWARTIRLLNIQAFFTAAGRPSHLNTYTVFTGLC